MGFPGPLQVSSACSASATRGIHVERGHQQPCARTLRSSHILKLDYSRKSRDKPRGPVSIGLS